MVNDPKSDEEYSIDGGKTWVKPDENGEVKFDGLTPGQEYEVVSRKAGDDTHNPSEPSEPTKVTTPKQDQDAPENEPDAEADTPTSIVVNDPSEDEEYSIDGGKTWVKPDENGDVKFDGLTPGKEYEVMKLSAARRATIRTTRANRASRRR